MNKIKRLNPAVVVVFVISIVLLVRHWFDWLTLCAAIASAAALLYSVVGGGKNG